MKIETLRFVGLVISAALYSVIFVCFLIDSPNLGAIMFGWISVFTFVAMALVKHSQLDLERRFKK